VNILAYSYFFHDYNALIVKVYFIYFSFHGNGFYLEKSER